MERHGALKRLNWIEQKGYQKNPKDDKRYQKIYRFRKCAGTFHIFHRPCSCCTCFTILEPVPLFVVLEILYLAICIANSSQPSHWGSLRITKERPVGAKGITFFTFQDAMVPVGPVPWVKIIENYGMPDSYVHIFH